MRVAALVLLGAVMFVPPRTARALDWPDVAERVEQDLQAADVATRRAAARRIAQLGPGRGGPLAVRALDDPDDEVKLAAADAAIRLDVPEASDAVAGWLNAPDPRLRRKACDVARSLPSARAVAPLARTLGDADADVRAAAAEALGHQAAGEAVPPLLGKLDDGSPAVRVAIVGALARLADPRAVVPLVGKVQDSSPDVREAVARALGDLGDRRASPALVLALRDQSNDVRRDALGALGRMKAPDAVDAVAPFTSDRTPSLRLAALAALGRIATPDALRVLVQNLGTAEDAGGSLDRTPVRDALVMAGARAVAPLHAVLVASPSPAVATSASWVLGALHASGEAAAIVGAMRRGALPTAAALHALVGAGTSAEVPVALEFVADGSPAVRDAALDAAGALLDPHHPDGRAVEPLEAALRDPRPTSAERARLAGLLGRAGAARAAPVLVELTRTHDAALRLAALDALGVLGAPGGDGDRAVVDALLDALGAGDAAVRLHAALGLAAAGGAAARDALLARLDGGDELDRAALLTALGGILERVPADAAIARLHAALDLAAGPERDALLDALGRAASPAATRVLATLARSTEPTDRREVAIVLAAHPGDPSALATARVLLTDPDAPTRAQAAWTLGRLGDASDEAALRAVTTATDIDAATNAAASLGRISARAHAPDLAARALCPLEHDARAAVRANALDGLALAGARCADGAVERSMLASDPSDVARFAAAAAVARAPTEDDARALERCARVDPSGAVAARCRTTPAWPERTHAVVVFVVGDGADGPRPGAAYGLRLADGLLRAGTTDRRGAVFDPAAPEGEVSLTGPSSLVR